MRISPRASVKPLSNDKFPSTWDYSLVRGKSRAVEDTEQSLSENEANQRGVEPRDGVMDNFMPTWLNATMKVFSLDEISL